MAKMANSKEWIEMVYGACLYLYVPSICLIILSFPVQTAMDVQLGFSTQ